jgi:hypothetical protein
MVKINAKDDVTIPVMAIPSGAPPSIACLHDMQPRTNATTAKGKTDIPMHGIIPNKTEIIPQTIDAMPNPRPFCFFCVSIVQLFFSSKSDLKTNAILICYSAADNFLIRRLLFLS